jgi:hypothetical protein
MKKSELVKIIKKEIKLIKEDDYWGPAWKPREQLQLTDRQAEHIFSDVYSAFTEEIDAAGIMNEVGIFQSIKDPELVVVVYGGSSKYPQKTLEYQGEFHFGSELPSFTNIEKNQQSYHREAEFDTIWEVKDSLSENKKSNPWAKFSFPDKEAFHEAIRILQDYDFRGTSAAIPRSDKMYYTEDEHRNRIIIADKNSNVMEQVLKIGNIPYKREVHKAPEYQIFNHGGHLD